MSLSELTTDQLLKFSEIALSIAGGIGAIILFVVGYKRYKKGQDWTRMEFLVEKVRHFLSDKNVQNAMAILDWDSRPVELFPGKEKYEDRFCSIDRKQLCRALIYHREILELPEGFVHTEIDIAVADVFDSFFLYLVGFHQYVESKLITHEELRPYIEYWIEELIPLDNEPTKAHYLTKQAIYIYLHQFGYKRVLDLCKMYFFTLKPELNAQEIREQLEALDDSVT
ncbi:MAG: hypothetical protein KDC07_11500 [Chitinophagaceae bacterium]|nr:hypothetical protein [Chitinophagaceae bacterium]